MDSVLSNSKKNFYFSFISIVLNICIGILIPRITIVGYGSELNGILTSAVQLVTYLSLFEAGIQSVATKSLYKEVANDNHNGINSIISAVNKNYKKIGCAYLAGLVAVALLFPLVSRTSVPYLTVIVIVFFTGFSNVISFFFQGKYKILMIVEGKNYIITNVTTITTILGNLLKVVLLLLKVNIPIVIIVVFLISLIQTFYISMYVKKHYEWLDINAVPNYESLKNNGSAVIHQISSLIFSNTDVLLLTIFCDLKAVSVYSIYKLVFSYLVNIVQIPFSSCNFAMGQLFYKDKKKYGDYLDVLDVAMACLSCPIVIVAMRMIVPFVNLYTNGADINYIFPVLGYLFGLMELLNLFRIPTVCTINIAGHFKETISRTIIESAINLIASIVLVIFIGIEGVVLGTVIALLYRTIDIWIYTNKKILYRKSAKTICIYGANFVLGMVMMLGLSQWHYQVKNYYEFFLVSIGCLIFVIVPYIIVNALIFKKEFKMLMSVLIKSCQKLRKVKM